MAEIVGKRTAKGYVLATVLLFILMISLPLVHSAGVPYTVYGFVKDHSGVLKNGINIIVKDITKIVNNPANPDIAKQYTLHTTTVQGQTQSGLYQANLGNMIGPWSRGDQIYVYAEYWDSQFHYYGSSTFILPQSGYLFAMNITADKIGTGELPQAPAGNHYPVLSSGQMTPVQGNDSTVFYFNVTYKDADNEAPYSIFAVVDGIYHGMSPVSGDYLTGKQYTYHTTLLSGDHNYWFFAGDGWANSSDSTSTLAGPHVLYSPVLSNWKVSPASGVQSTDFTYSVVYTSEEGTEPISIYLSIAGQNGSIQYSMTKVSGTPKTGETYQCIVSNHMLSPTTYKIFANDGNYKISTIKYDGPLVLAGTEINKSSTDDTMLRIGILSAMMIFIIVIVVFARMRKRTVYTSSAKKPVRQQRYANSISNQPISNQPVANKQNFVRRAVAVEPIRRVAVMEQRIEPIKRIAFDGGAQDMNIVRRRRAE